MLDIENETCKIAMPYETTDFRNTVVKPYFRNETGENAENVTNEKNTDHESEISVNAGPEKISQANMSFEGIFQPPSPNSPPARNRGRPRKLPLRYRNGETNISIFFQDDPQDLLLQHMQSAPFVKSRKKKINDFFEKDCFEVVTTANLFREIRIFNSRFVDEIKNIGTANAYEKFRLMMQAYNDEEKIEVLIQTFTIQRMNQRLILTLTASMSHLSLFLRDISQVYVQSNISLAKKFFIRSPAELNFEDGAILKIIKPLYEVPEAGTHWFNTYHKHHTEKLVMQQFTYDSCLLYISNKGKNFEIVELQIDDILIFENEIFANSENFHLHEIKLLAKDRDQFTFKHFFKFNDAYIKQEGNSFHLNQNRLCKNLRLMTLKSNDLTNAKNVIKKK